MPAVFNIHAPEVSVFTACVIKQTNLQPFSAYSGLTQALITVETLPVRYRVDGVTAHSATGHLLNNGDNISLAGAGLITNFRVLCPAGTAYLMVSLGV
jgi:hypothetical protein